MKSNHDQECCGGMCEDCETWKEDATITTEPAHGDKEQQRTATRKGRWLMWHPESNSLYEEYHPGRYEEALNEGVEDATDIKIHEARFIDSKMRMLTCENRG